MFLKLAATFLLALYLWAAAPPDGTRIDALAESLRKAQGAPGLAVAVITKEGVYAHGYGTRGAGQPVTTRTIFAIGSLTKSFTALAAATLVDEGKLDWDKPVREYLPWFRLYDPHAGELMTIRDLLTHRSGLPRYDLLRYAVPLPREELVKRLRYLPPTASFRERYQYQNLMYNAAGYLAGVVDGSSWEEMIERRILAPLELRDTTVRVADTKRRADFALPHERVGGTLRQVEFYDYQKFGVGPNGAVNASVDDMVRYLRFHMGDGMAGGKRVLSKRQMQELHRQQMVVNDRESYALGWTVSWPGGIKLVCHGGSITGFRAWAGIMPEKGEGVAVLMNADGNPASVARRISREVLGWNLREEPAAEKPRGRVRTPSRISTGPTSRAPEAYAGRYEHPAFGTCEVIHSSGNLTLQFPALTLPLKHFHFDVFVTGDDTREGIRGAGMAVQFILDTAGEVAEMWVRVDPAAPMVVFKHKK